MPRKPRIHVNDGVYHVLLRGNQGQKIFLCEDDFHFFLGLIQEGVARFDHRIHAFCFMPNHVHFAIQVGEVHLSRIMQNLAFRFARRINWKCGQIGHLFQGRYKAILVDAESYLLELIRYIHLNPVRAKMVDRPEEFRWSSHRAYLGGAFFPWLTTRWILDQMHLRPYESKQAFHRFVMAGTNDAIKNEDRRKIIRFLDEGMPSQKHEKPFPRASLDNIVELVCVQYRLSENQLRSSRRSKIATEARAVIGCLVKTTGCTTLTMVARRFNASVPC